MFVQGDTTAELEYIPSLIAITNDELELDLFMFILSLYGTSFI